MKSSAAKASPSRPTSFGDADKRQKQFNDMMAEIDDSDDSDEDGHKQQTTRAQSKKADSSDEDDAKVLPAKRISEGGSDSKAIKNKEKSSAKSLSPKNDDFGDFRAPANVKGDMNALKAFVMRPLSKGERMIQCYVERHRSGTNILNPVYALHLEDGKQFLLAGKKRIRNKTSNYLIAMDKSPTDRRSTMVTGKLRANWSGSEYTIYDHGLNPTKTALQSETRKIMGIVGFEYDKMGPGRMQAIIPKCNDNGIATTWIDTGEIPPTGTTLMSVMTKQEPRRHMTLKNKRPKFDEHAGGHVLNFHGRVTMSSVKNFQMECEENGEDTVLQFGRISCQPPGPHEQCPCHKNIFTLDFKHPLSPFQAFAICLAALDGKLADSRGFETMHTLAKKL